MGLLDKKKEFKKAKPASFQVLGDEFAGPVASEPREVQQRDFDTDEPLFWDEGKNQPKMQLVVEVQTDRREGLEDDGRRAIFVRGQMLAETKRVVNAADREEIREGDFFGVKWVNEQQPVDKITGKPKRGKPQKIYEVQFKPGTGQRLLRGDPWQPAKQDDEPPF